MTFPLRQKCHIADRFVYQKLSTRYRRPTTNRKGKMTSLYLIFAMLIFPLFSSAKALTETELLAGTLTAEQIGDNLASLPKIPTNTAIFSIKLSSGIDPSFGDYLESETNRILRENHSISLVQCFECRSPQIEVRDDKLVVKKGAPDVATLAKLGKQLTVDSFIKMEVFRTKFSITTEITLLQASDGAILYTNQIRVPALDWTDDGLQLILGLGPAQTTGGYQDAPDPNRYSTIGHLFIYEEVGFGKAGFAISSLNGSLGKLYTLTPAVGWRARFGTTGIYSLKSLGLGFGTSDGITGGVVRLDYALMLGSFTALGVNWTGFSPFGNKDNKAPILSTFNFYVGFNFGR